MSSLGLSFVWAWRICSASCSSVLAFFFSLRAALLACSSSSGSAIFSTAFCAALSFFVSSLDPSFVWASRVCSASCSSFLASFFSLRAAFLACSSSSASAFFSAAFCSLSFFMSSLDLSFVWAWRICSASCSSILAFCLSLRAAFLACSSSSASAIFWAASCSVLSFFFSCLEASVVLSFVWAWRLCSASCSSILAFFFSLPAAFLACSSSSASAIFSAAFCSVLSFFPSSLGAFLVLSSSNASSIGSCESCISCPVASSFLVPASISFMKSSSSFRVISVGSSSLATFGSTAVSSRSPDNFRNLFRGSADSAASFSIFSSFLGSLKTLGSLGSFCFFFFPRFTGSSLPESTTSRGAVSLAVSKRLENH